MTARSAEGLAPVEVNLLGVVEHPEIGESPYLIDTNGAPYVPVGDGGIVLGLSLGDSVFAADADHAAPGACLAHPDQAARHALVMQACIGNRAEVRSGAATGATGAVIGKRGENGRVIVAFRPADLEMMRPGDHVGVRSRGQGFRPDWVPGEVTVMNVDPDLLAALPVARDQPAGPQRPVLDVAVRAVLPAKLAGNGIGRPAAGWDLDLQLSASRSADSGLGADLLLGDLVALTDIDARYNMGYRAGWVTVGVIVHGASPLPGHGPGMTPILTGPERALRVRFDGQGHAGLTARTLGLQ